MDIYLLRHGVAEEPRPGLGDHERALTDEGHKRLQRASGAWQKLAKGPDVVFVSPLRRARETADIFVEAMNFRGELRIENALVPSAPPNGVMMLLEAENLSGTEAVALIGHEPHLGYLLGALVAGNPRTSVPLKKGMLVGLSTLSTASVASELRFALSQKTAAQLG